ncbi:MAG: queuosine precursor transporter, partial [Saprospiraceae bacterium]|nr:queuosine precursor transporter [Saprospiraceae bacterium]
INEAMPENSISNMNVAFQKIMGQGLWIIIGSMVAFLVGQIVDVWVFHGIKKRTGEKKVWLRATGSTLVSQFIDSFIVLFIAFYIGADWDLIRVLAIGMVNYSYKFLMAVLLTPAIYLAHFIIDNYLGEETAHQMKEEAALSVG